MMKITKAVLPVAGLGTRTLPASKSVPKEMFPLLNKPVIQYLVEEALEADIREIIFVISKDKEVIRHYFQGHDGLEALLSRKGKSNALGELNRLLKKLRFHFCYQNEPLGDGQAILAAQDFLNDQEACAVLFGDDLILNKVGGLKQLLKHYSHCRSSVVAVTEISPKESNKYGIAIPKMNIKKNDIGSCFEVGSMVEKPLVPPALFGIIGKYIITPTVIKNLKHARGSHDQEIRLIDGLITTLRSGEEKIFACALQGERYDTGNIIGLLKANMAYALRDEHFQEELSAFFAKTKMPRKRLK